MPALRQSAANSVAKYQSRNCRVTFSTPTLPGSLIVVICVNAGGLDTDTDLDSSAYVKFASKAVRDLQLTFWYRENAPATTSLNVSVDASRSLQVRAFEYTGVAQTNALDKFAWYSSTSETSTILTPSTGNLAASGELILGVMANQYASTTQYGFTGGLAKLYESTSPSGGWNDGNEDWEKSRATFHQAFPTGTTPWQLAGRLSTSRRWISFLMTFRSGTSGPARFTALNDTNMLSPAGGNANLTVFGQLRSTINTRMLGEVRGEMARIGPFDYQYRLGGWTGLLIGTGTEYPLESVSGLEGWDMRTSDDELPRGDGSLRGVDLQSSRQILFKGAWHGSHEQIEEKADNLYRTLIPQRDTDWELIYRHPGRPLRIVYVRPTQLTRELNQQQLLLHDQSFALRAADPRHYSAVLHTVTLPVNDNDDDPSVTGVLNLGNSFAYPEISIFVKPTSQTISKIELVNSTIDSVFDFRAILAPGSTMIADMSARATGIPKSIITVDGQSKYGAWQFPREAFRLTPGENLLQLRTTPAGTPVTCILRYRDTWSG